METPLHFVDIHCHLLPELDDGAAIVFHFANDDGLWTPGEESLARTVEFGVTKGTAIAFIARLDLGALHFQLAADELDDFDAAPCPDVKVR